MIMIMKTRREMDSKIPPMSETYKRGSRRTSSQYQTVERPPVESEQKKKIREELEKYDPWIMKGCYKILWYL